MAPPATSPTKPHSPRVPAPTAPTTRSPAAASSRAPAARRDARRQTARAPASVQAGRPNPQSQHAHAVGGTPPQPHSTPVSAVQIELVLPLLPRLPSTGPVDLAPWDSFDRTSRKAFVSLLCTLFACGGAEEDRTGPWDGPWASDIRKQLATAAQEQGVEAAVTRDAVRDAMQYLREGPAYGEDLLVGWLPRTTREVKKLQQAIDDLLQEGELFAAFPFQCRKAVHGLWTRPKHANTLRAVVTVLDALLQRNVFSGIAILHWVLLGAQRLWGMDSPDTQRLVRRAAGVLSETVNTRNFESYNQLVPELVQQLPGGLGWGSTVVAPVTDTEAYRRHEFMYAKALDIYEQGHYKLAKDMFQRCVAYYETLGQHWLGKTRALVCLRSINQCVRRLEGPAAAEPLMHAARRRTQKELGPHHRITIEANELHADILFSLKRYGQSASLFQKACGLRQQVYGPYHATVFSTKVCYGKPLCTSLHTMAANIINSSKTFIWVTSVVFRRNLDESGTHYEGPSYCVFVSGPESLAVQAVWPETSASLIMKDSMQLQSCRDVLSQGCFSAHGDI